MNIHVYIFTEGEKEKEEKGGMEKDRRICIGNALDLPFSKHASQCHEHHAPRRQKPL